MRLIAKAALGALAIASIGFGVSAPANAQHVIVTTPGGVVTTAPGVVVNPCLRAPEFRPAYCFRDRDRDRDRFAYLMPDRDRMMREHMWRERQRREEFERHEAIEHGGYGY